MEKAVEDEDFDFSAEGVALAGCLSAGGIGADGEVAGRLLCGPDAGDGIGGEGEDVGGLVLAAEVAVEGLDFLVGGEQNADGAFEAHGGLSLAEEGGERADRWQKRGGHASVSFGFA
jgi:hypothetical protein